MITNPITPPAIIESVDQGDTMSSLQNIIERNLVQLKELKAKKKLLVEEEKSLLENDSGYQQAVENAKTYIDEVKIKKAKIKGTPTAVQLKAKKTDLVEQEKEIKENLSDHLTNYYNLTNSKFFETSTGNEVWFQIKASVSSKQLSLF